MDDRARPGTETPDDRLRAFGRAVRARRLTMGLTQEALAEAASLDQTYVSGVENGRRNPTLRVVFRLADALALRTGDLFDERSLI